MQNNPENVDPDTFFRDIFLDNLNDEALRRRKALAKEIRIQNKLEKSLSKKASYPSDTDDRVMFSSLLISICIFYVLKCLHLYLKYIQYAQISNKKLKFR